MNRENIIAFLSYFPMELSQMDSFITKSKTLKAVPLRDDLSFKAFWSEYDYKLGNKARAEKLWNKLSDADKQMVFDKLPKYAYYLIVHDKMEKLYPETFLHQRRFEGDFEVKKSTPTR